MLACLFYFAFLFAFSLFSSSFSDQTIGSKFEFSHNCPQNSRIILSSFHYIQFRSVEKICFLFAVCLTKSSLGIIGKKNPNFSAAEFKDSNIHISFSRYLALALMDGIHFCSHAIGRLTHLKITIPVLF